METPAYIDQSRDRAAVVLIRSLQAVKPPIVEESLGDAFPTLWSYIALDTECY